MIKWGAYCNVCGAGGIKKAQKCLKWIEKQADKNFLLPEQVNICHWIYYEIWKKDGVMCLSHCSGAMPCI